MTARPTIWLGRNMVLHYPSPHSHSPYTTACGQPGPPVTPIPVGKFTTCKKCRLVLGT